MPSNKKTWLSLELQQSSKYLIKGTGRVWVGVIVWVGVGVSVLVGVCVGVGVCVRQGTSNKHNSS